MRILVVDDDAVFREEFSEFLEHSGHAVTSEPSVPRALEALARAEYDLLFTDLRMPRQSGLDLLKEARQRAPRTLVVLVTGYASISTAVEAMKTGAFDYLTKPYHASQIEEILRLAEAERAYTESILPSRDPVRVARSLAESGKHVLVVGPMEGPIPAGVELLPFDGLDLARFREAVEGFLADPAAGGIVVPDVGVLLRHHRLEDVVAALEVAHASLKGRGPLAVGFDPNQIARDQLPALLSVVASAAVQGTIEAMDSPIRRIVLKRLHEGPARFADLMRASQLNDSPKLSFHLHRLDEAGLVGHVGELYRLTPKGEEAVEALRGLEEDVAGSSRSGFFFRREKTPAAPKPKSGTGRPGRRATPKSASSKKRRSR